MRKIKIAAVFVGLGVLAFLLGAAPSSITYDYQGPSKQAKTLATGSCVLGDANDDSLYIQIGFVPQVFWCWRAPQSDGADVAERFMWFTGMNAGTAITGGMAVPASANDHDSIIASPLGVKILTGAAGDTMPASNKYCLKPNDTYRFKTTYSGIDTDKITGVMLGEAITDGGAVTDKLFWVAFP